MTCKRCDAQVGENEIHGPLACLRNLLAWYEKYRDVIQEMESKDALVLGEEQTTQRR